MSIFIVYITAPHLSLHPNHTSEVLRAAAADENAPEGIYFILYYM